MMMGDADRVRSAGGSSMDVLAALRRQFQHNPPAMAKLRKFAETSDGARITFGHYQGSFALLRRTRDGKTVYISLDTPYADIMALE